MATIQELLDYGKEKLSESGNEYSKYERKVLLEHVLGVNYMYMLMNGNEQVSDTKMKEYERLIKRRCEHYPLQYLLGYAHFMDYTFYVDENVLIPRSDTEILVETINDMYDRVAVGKNDPLSVLDMCCGSGCIGISVKQYHKDIVLSLSDISDKALSITEKNLEKYNITDVHINHGNLFEGLDGKYDIIVCNPPYIETDIIGTLMPEVKDYEPMLALDGGDDGLMFYRKIIDEAGVHLTAGGYIFFEIGYNQGKSVSELLETAGFTDVTIKKDYSGMDRVVYGHL